ncbi:SDR family NAD(P)-dependent oxidoreductase [Terriglobus saanensis]|uniref:Short-chain dehydrogenase/reductase SDR n=1 Tax=Terriglobus saanensis (strain ATCC BAA-1853 / DSM 23119 / SP1PR4) TaxID=401053 RepID=E8V4W3_TERSS|nr:glucose 1-dehydrogenase [Terriglobus saanensis]ADV82591.1 short-chain dehydrogenase/reductase SDR [Terriglobus saanensis SP1PR4]
MSDQRLAGKVAIVTGCSSGIGQGIAVRLAKDGADIVVNYHSDQAGGEATKAQIEALGRKAVVIGADVSKLPEIQPLIDAAWSNFGRADILVNNAGVEKGANFWEANEADYDLVLQVNLKGPYFTTQAFVKKLIETKMPGRVINISSVHEEMVFPHFASYCASKGGLMMLMRDLAVELGPFGITVNNIAPGAIATPINKSLLNDRSKLDPLLRNIPLGRMGTVDDVSAVAAFLASDEASYVTGSTYVVDGGLMRNYKEQ